MAKKKNKKKGKKEETQHSAEHVDVAAAEPKPKMSNKEFEKELETAPGRAGQDAGVGQGQRRQDLRGLRRA